MKRLGLTPDSLTRGSGGEGPNEAQPYRKSSLTLQGYSHNDIKWYHLILQVAIFQRVCGNMR
jgi:hypothetical protein